MRQPHVHATSLYTNVHRRTPTYTDVQYQYVHGTRTPTISGTEKNKTKSKKEKKKVNIFFHFLTIKTKKYQSKLCVRTNTMDRNERNNISPDFSSRFPRHAMQRRQPYSNTLSSQWTRVPFFIVYINPFLNKYFPPFCTRFSVKYCKRR